MDQYSIWEELQLLVKSLQTLLSTDQRGPTYSEEERTSTILLFLITYSSLLTKHVYWQLN